MVKRRTVSMLAVSSLAAVAMLACGTANDPHVLTFSGSAVGREAEVIRRQLDRFQAAHPGLTVALRATPDAADQRHQLYVQWLNARATDPDVLQLDVVWTPEFAAAGWIAEPRSLSTRTPVDRSSPRPSPPTAGSDRSTRCPGSSTSACLYWRTDLMPHAPRDLAELSPRWRVHAQDDHGACRSVSSGRAPATRAWSRCFSSISARLAAAFSTPTAGCVVDSDAGGEGADLDARHDRRRSTSCRRPC